MTDAMIDRPPHGAGLRRLVWAGAAAVAIAVSMAAFLLISHYVL
jgi:hypothetical protein